MNPWDVIPLVEQSSGPANDDRAMAMQLVDVVYNMRLAAANQMITKSKQLPKRLAEAH